MNLMFILEEFIVVLLSQFIQNMDSPEMRVSLPFLIFAIFDFFL
jgi:hypothetical protein